MPRKSRKIGLFFPPTLGYFADVMMGVQEFARSQGNWFVEVCENAAIATHATRTWRPDGVLANLGESNWARLVGRLNVPVVQVGGTPTSIVHRVMTDDPAIGRLAAGHLLDRGFRHFAFCGYSHLAWSTGREAAFRASVAAVARTSDVFHSGPGGLGVWNVATTLAPFVKNLSKPVGIFACHDRMAMLVGDACWQLGLKVPDDVAILGVDDNPQECAFTSPPISSIMGSARRIGYQAAELLEKLMRGARVSEKSLLVAPAGVSARASTDVLAAEDADVVAALRFIRTHADETIDVSDLADATLVSRRMLERKFQAVLHRSPRQQILKAHVELAQSLLINTPLSALAISVRSGFPSGSKFSAVFKRETGLSPTKFRNLYGMAEQRKAK